MKKSKKFSMFNTMLIIIILFANIYLTSVNLTKAKYISELYGNGLTYASNWDISLKCSDTSQSNDYNIPLTFLPVPGSLEDFSITIDATGCDTSIPIKYEIKIEPVSTSIPSNIKFYIGSETNSVLNATYTGSMQGGNSQNIIINFRWALTDTNEDNFQGVPLKFSLKIQAYSST